MTLREFTHFVALAPEFIKVQTTRELTPAAMVTAMLYNINRKKGSPAKAPQDFLKKLPKPQLPEQSSAASDSGLALFCWLLESVVKHE